MWWLRRAQDGTPDDGVSQGFHLYHGWLSSYPETTGYIIETFWDYGRSKDEQSWVDRAILMTDWLLSLQHEDGWIPDPSLTKPLVFDTGQVLFGLIRSYRETGNPGYLAASKRAGDWLVEVQTDDGSWERFAYNEIPHSYYSRVGWSLAELYELTGDARYLDAASRNAEWTLGQQQPNGWYRRAAFGTDEHSKPFTHTIAYTIRGMFEMGRLIGDARLIDSAQDSITALLDRSPSGRLPAATYGPAWEGDYSSSCLTGDAQLAIILFRLAQVRSSKALFDRGSDLNRLLSGLQVHGAGPDIEGAIAGSSPIWGSYIHYAYPNWATKFLAEALMSERSVGEGLRA